METLAQDFADVLLGSHAPPCLSLYLPTHRHHPDNRQDPIRFKNLLTNLQASLEQAYPKQDHTGLLRPFHALTDDEGFWNQTLDGLGILASSSLFRLYRLQRPVPERALVADSFHVKPLIRILQSADRYQVLALTRQHIRLFEGNRDVLDEVPLAEGVPSTIEEALGDELTEPYLTGSTRTSSGALMYHGHGSRDEAQEKDTERFFRAVDRAVWLHHSRPSGLPLILATLPEHQTVFRRVSHNQSLMDAAVRINPDTLDLETLRRLAWEVEEPRYLEMTAQLVNRFQSALGTGLASAELTQVAEAATHARVATLLVDADRYIPGKLNVETGRIEAVTAPDVDDVLDDLGELVLKRGGETVVLPNERMPTRTGVAAIYRF